MSSLGSAPRQRNAAVAIRLNERRSNSGGEHITPATAARVTIRYSRFPKGGPETEPRPILNHIFGRTITEDDIKRLVSAEPGDHISVRTSWAKAPDEEVTIRASGTGKAHPRDFTLRRDGNEVVIVSPLVRNDGLRSAASGRAIGRAFANMRAVGITRLDAAARRGVDSSGNEYNGYWTWARMGFTGPIPDRLSIQAQLLFGRSVKNVEQLMATKERRDWWRKNGTTWDASFDFHDGSYSMREFARLFGPMSDYE